ncbi:hypothetical protein [Thermomonas fusca]|uniref:Glycosyltransferase family 1 protein n=1 Tax=Thermomonas fusca TaxID=215690 RepID=A0A5R9PE55_9GAMM|nr:hypothetical protein [Thermomonas fusca]TLX21357.1 hypothetical protein E5S66_10485 [Thermomonas fusca]
MDSEFKVIKNSLSLLLFLVANERKVKAIFSLSSSDFLVSAGVLSFLGMKIKHVMGIYHPKQWAVMLDSAYSRARSRVFRRVMEGVPPENMIFNSSAALDSSRDLINFGPGSVVLVAPSVGPVPNKPYNPLGSLGCMEVVTVGRFVDFKVSSVIQMIRLVDRINDEIPGRLRYIVYGEGPCRHQLEEEAGRSRHPEFVEIKEVVPRELFSTVVSGAQIFFGMGFAVVHAAMLGIPSLIAIQDERGPVTYGWFSKYDHLLSPMFGDVSPQGVIEPLDGVIREFLSLSGDERVLLASSCVSAAAPYQGEKVAADLKKFILASSFIDCRVSLMDLLRIRVEVYLSRFRGVKGIHA